MRTNFNTGRAVPLISVTALGFLFFLALHRFPSHHSLGSLINNKIPSSWSSPSSSLSSSHTTLREIHKILTTTPPEQSEFAWTDGEGSGKPLITIGSKAHFIEFDDSEIIDVRTGKSLANVNEGHSFNLAVAKLPHGSRWGFVGVTRGPTRRRKFMQVNGNDSREQILVAFGLNITSSGQLFAVTPGQTLDIPMIPKEGCAVSGVFVATYGPEDPRLFWTDRGTIGLTFGRNSADIDSCRDIGYIDDLRSVYAPLSTAMSIEDGATEYDAVRIPGQTVDRELVREFDQSKIEKNWVAFFPGPSPDGISSNPHIHYSYSPDLSLEPTTSDIRSISYKDIPNPHPSNPQIATCLSDNHPAWPSHKLHQSTPFYRLTLCERGCLADESNTVMITLGHAEWRPRYAKFISVYNVTAPYEPISVGPIFNIDGLNDIHHINYGMSLTPLEPSDLHPSIQKIRTPKHYLPGHFFIDDLVLITLGHADKEMVSSTVPMRELLGRQRVCAPLMEELDELDELAEEEED